MDYKDKVIALLNSKELSKEQKEELELIFPELKESEDERMKGAIIATIHLYYGEPLEDEAKEMISWLEKQGEQKSTDKDEQKFHEGDLVVDNCGYVWKIKGILNQFYLLEDEEGEDGSLPTIECVNKDFHLWTIQDAKDGDVLCYHCSGTAFFLIGIFKRVASKKEIWGGTYINYAQYGGYGSIENYTLKVALDNDELYHCGSIACPATKEQRDLLFQRMKEAGYEWDSEKKELKKIELKTLNPDKVIAWLVANICDFEYYVKLFKKDFGL